VVASAAEYRGRRMEIFANVIERSRGRVAASLAVIGLTACMGAEPEGLAPASSADTTVVMDFYHRPLPNLPLPNDLATRYDATSPTERRINASKIAPTWFERLTREMVDTLDGWGTFAPITVPFSAEIDVTGIVKHHHGNRDLADDLVYVVDIDRDSPEFGKAIRLDVGEGNFPVVLERLDSFWEADPRGNTNTLLFEEYDEDANGNGTFDEGEDNDLDGHFDKPNYLPGVTKKTSEMNLAERADATMTFYERETNTLILRPLLALRERNRYAVVVTRRLKDKAGKPVGSPYPFINHIGQNEGLAALPDALSAEASTYGNLGLEDIAFTWSFTTGSMSAGLVAVREGLYGSGAQKHLHDEYPPDIGSIAVPWTKKPGKQWESKYTFSAETFIEVNAQLGKFGAELLSVKGEFGKRFSDAVGYVDFHVMGTYNSPQLMRRTDADGNYLSYNEMTWPPDVHRVKAAARSEKVTFWLTVPRREAIDAANAKLGIGKGQPAPVAIIGHGYTSTRFEVLTYHAFFARHGVACLAIDNVSHGLAIPQDYKPLVPPLLSSLKAKGIGEAILENRMWDQDQDGEEDSGADFWTAYTFHTRDNVRQTAVDYMQLVRVLRAFDGKYTWQFDANDDGKSDDIAGDFNGDGKVDIGGPKATITMTGSSLGGIMSAVMAGVEPQIAASVPIAGGAGLGDVGIRSIQGGVKEAVQLRMMGPLYIGYPDKDGSVVVRTVVPRLNRTAKIEVARIPKKIVDKLKTNGAVYAFNRDNGEYDCALVRKDGSFRVALASDAHGDADKDKRQRHVLSFYAKDVFKHGVVDPNKHRACARKDNVTPLHVIDKFAKDVEYHFQSKKTSFKAGDPLAPLAEGLGLHRARPEMRRFMAFAQMVLDPGDPATYVRHAVDGKRVYSNGETVRTNMLVWHNVGDMNVPVSTGASIARCAGLVDMDNPVKAWGNRTVNQALIDGHVLEAVDVIPRYKAPNGAGVLFDPEDLALAATLTTGTDIWNPGGKTFAKGADGYYLPRLRPPLHKHAVKKRDGMGYSGLFVPMVKPTGQHDPEQPGKETDRLRKRCIQEHLAAKKDPAPCQTRKYFDQGALVYEMLGYFLASGGKRFSLDRCQVDWTCGDLPPKPPVRK